MINTIFWACNLSVNAIFDFVYYSVPPDIIVDSGRYQLTIRVSEVCMDFPTKTDPKYWSQRAVALFVDAEAEEKEEEDEEDKVDERLGGPEGKRGKAEFGMDDGSRSLSLSPLSVCLSHHLFSQ